VFIGHKFNDKISLFSEIEIEDAKVGDGLGEVSFEQAFVKFGLTRDVYVIAGLFVPRIGITNENHLPTTFNSVFRTRLETVLIPSTWREIGVGLYGSIRSVQGLNYSLGLVNGLNAAGFNFKEGTGIREGRFEGRNATASNLAVTGALLYYIGDFRIQVSGYYGGTVGLPKHSADSLGLNSGSFGTPVAMAEANIQYNHKGFYARAMDANIFIKNADKLNIAYANNAPEQMGGFYVEAGYNLLETTTYKQKPLTVFARYENIDLNAKIPTDAINNDALKQQYVFVGISYQPVKGVILKADYEINHTGNPNPALIINPNPNAPAYLTNKNFINLGLGYSF
jgi:hypothetical protein